MNNPSTMLYGSGNSGSGWVGVVVKSRGVVEVAVQDLVKGRVWSGKGRGKCLGEIEGFYHR